MLPLHFVAHWLESVYASSAKDVLYFHEKTWIDSLQISDPTCDWITFWATYNQHIALYLSESIDIILILNT